MITDDLILIGLNVKASMLLGDTLNRRQQRSQIFNIRRISTDGIEQCFPLIAIALVAHVKNIFELRVMRKHAIVEVCG